MAVSSWLSPFSTEARKARADAGAARELAIAEALAAERRFDEAIAYATERNRRRRNPMLEWRLIQWRNKAYDTCGVRVGVAGWPPSAPDLFPGLVGLAEIERGALSSKILASAIQHHGGLIVRNFIPKADAESLAKGIDRTLGASEAQLAGAPLAETLPWYGEIPLEPDDPLAFGRGATRRPDHAWAADSPRMFFDLVEMYERTGTIDLLTAHLGERPALSIGKFTLRKASPHMGGDWHQDGSFLGADIKTVNIWLALSHCGEDASALDVVARRLPYIVETGTHGANFKWTVGHGMAEIAADGAPIVSPVFAPGDAFLFDHFLLHRTSSRPTMTKHRFAIESWFFAPSTYPLDRGPLVI